MIRALRGTVALLFLPAALYSFEIKGNIYRSDNRNEINSALIILKDTNGGITNSESTEDGFFTIKYINAGSYTIEIKAPGFYSEKKELTINHDITVNFYLTAQSTMSLGEIDVVGEKMKSTVSKNNISKNLRQKATASAMQDPVAVMTKMPGVDSLNSRDSKDTTRFSVRGGGGNENIALLDEALIKYPYHKLFGDSVFIDELVESMSLYKGVVPAEYGQAMSSVLQVNSEEGSPGFHGKLSIGLLNSSLTFNGATPDQKWNWSGGLRRTSYDWLMYLFAQDRTSDIQIPSYWDSHGRIQYKSEEDTLSFVWQFSAEPTLLSNLSMDKDKTNSMFGQMDYYNTVLNLYWKHIFSHTFYLEQSLGGLLSYQLQDIRMSSMTNYLASQEFDVRYKAAAAYSPSDFVQFKLGGEIIYYPKEYYSNLLTASYTNQITGLSETTNFTQNSYSGQMGIYALFLENETYIFDSGFYFQDGIRLNYADYISKYSFDPRLTLGYKWTQKDRVYVSAGYLSECPTDTATLSYLDTNANLEIPGCWHYVLGTQLFLLGSLGLTVEGYFKDYQHTISYESNAKPSYHTEGQEKHVYGIEFLLEKKPDELPLYGWISFSGFQSTGYRDTGIDPNMPYSSGSSMGGFSVAGQSSLPPVKEWYTDDATNPYKLNITMIWDMNKNWSFTSEFEYKAGSYYTPITNTQKIGSYYKPLYGTYNSERNPDQHSLNLKVEYSTLLFDLPFGAYLQINNVYNYRPVTGYTYTDNYTTKTAVQSMLGIYPTLGVWLKW